MKIFNDHGNHESGNQGADQDHERERKAKRKTRCYEYYELFPQGEHLSPGWVKVSHVLFSVPAPKVLRVSVVVCPVLPATAALVFLGWPFVQAFLLFPSDLLGLPLSTLRSSAPFPSLLSFFQTLAVWKRQFYGITTLCVYGWTVRISNLACFLFFKSSEIFFSSSFST